MTQCMHSLGYIQAANLLEEESGVKLLSGPVTKFRDGVLAGEWGLVESLIANLQLLSESSVSVPNANRVPRSHRWLMPEPWSQEANVRFLVYRQKYLELLEAQQTPEALACLREQLAPLERHGPLQALVPRRKCGSRAVAQVWLSCRGASVALVPWRK